MDKKHLPGNNKNPSKYTNPSDTYVVNHIKHCDKQVFVKIIGGTEPRMFRCRYLSGPRVYIHEPVNDESYLSIPDDARVMDVFGSLKFKNIHGMWWYQESKENSFPVGIWPSEVRGGRIPTYVVWPLTGDCWKEKYENPVYPAPAWIGSMGWFPSLAMPVTAAAAYSNAIPVSLPAPPLAPPPPPSASSSSSSSSATSQSLSATHVFLEAKKFSKKNYRELMKLRVRNCAFYPITVQSLDEDKKNETWEVVTLEFTSNQETWKFNDDQYTATLIDQELRKDTLVYLALSTKKTLNLVDLSKHIMKQKGLYNNNSKTVVGMTLH